MSNSIHIISGNAHWASVLAPNVKYDPVYSIDVELLDDDSKSMVESLGLTIKNKGDGRNDFVTIKRKLMKNDGDERPAPIIKDSANNAWDDKLIGNGSKVNVKFGTYDWTYAGKSGVGADLMAVQVVDLVPYGNDSNFESVDDGYVVSAVHTEDVVRQEEARAPF
tara:strand:- start:10 stop:504 length:495 start_codon:yes stop_codon:yes gene_type:complete